MPREIRARGHGKSFMSTTKATLCTACNRRSYRCYNWNDAFHITTTAGVSFSFRCPRCFYRHLLSNYTIASFVPFPKHLNLTNYILSTNDSVTFNYLDSIHNPMRVISMIFLLSSLTHHNFVHRLLNRL